MLRKLQELASVVFLAFVFLTLIMHLWTAEWHVPFQYSGGDPLESEAVIKSVIDTGTYLENPFLGAPGQFEYYDYPRTEHFQIFIVRILSVFSKDYALVINSFFVFTFPLTAVIAFSVLRSFRISFISALVASLLYAFVPYHFVRGETHFFLSCYFLIPVSVAICLWICRNESFMTRNAKRQLRPTLKGIAATLFCILIASSGTYYTFFTCFLILISAIYAFTQTKRWSFLAPTVFFLIILIGVSIINVVPAIRYTLREGKNPKVARRSFMEAEIYGLKMTGLLLPAAGHRFPPLNRMLRRYPAASMNENYSAYLGIVGVAGFLILLAWLFFPKTRIQGQELCENLSVLNGSLVLLGLSGSLGPLFAFLIFSEFRGYNRVSIFLAFFVLFALALVLDTLKKKYSDAPLKRMVFMIVSFGILIFGLWEQTLPAYVATKPKQVADFRSDAAFVKEIESKLPSGSMIFQLPYHSFPEAAPEHRMNDYDHFRGYLHSTALRWSYGAMKGRKWDKWQHEISSLPIPEFIQALRSTGFRGLYFDRFGYARQDQTEKEIQEILGEPAAVSEDKRLSFYLITLD